MISYAPYMLDDVNNIDKGRLEVVSLYVQQFECLKNIMRMNDVTFCIGK